MFFMKKSSFIVFVCNQMMIVSDLNHHLNSSLISYNELVVNTVNG